MTMTDKELKRELNDDSLIIDNDLDQLFEKYRETFYDSKKRKYTNRTDIVENYTEKQAINALRHHAWVEAEDYLNSIRSVGLVTGFKDGFIEIALIISPAFHDERAKSYNFTKDNPSSNESEEYQDYYLPSSDRIVMKMHIRCKSDEFLMKLVSHYDNFKAILGVQLVETYPESIMRNLITVNNPEGGNSKVIASIKLCQNDIVMNL